MAIKNNELSGRAIIICIFIGFLTIVLVFLFIKRQIIRFTLKSGRGPHLPIGAGSPACLKREIERRFKLINEIQYEPPLINSEHQFEEFAGKKTDEDGVPTPHVYRMKAVDDLKYLEELLISIGGKDIQRKARTDLGEYLYGLCKPGQVLYNCDSKLLSQFIQLYEHARHDAIPEFGRSEYKEYVYLHRKLQKFLIRKHDLSSKGVGILRQLSESNSNISIKQKSGTQITMVGRTSLLTDEDSHITRETCV